MSIPCSPCNCPFCRFTRKRRASVNAHLNEEPRKVDPPGAENQSEEPRTKIKMTPSWIDHLLCQLTSNKKLSTFETLPPEILDPILDELHRHSIHGLQALAQVSRTCQALATPYRFKPLRANFEELDAFYSVEASKRASVVLTYSNDLKTLQIDGPIFDKSKEYPSIESILKDEHSFDCIDFMLHEDYLSDSGCNELPRALEFLNKSCPAVSKLIIDLGKFHMYSFGWDRKSREPRGLNFEQPLEKCPRQPMVNPIAVALASFSGLRQLVVQFGLQWDQYALMHPGQGRQAVREMYDEIRTRKKGSSLIQINVTFSMLTRYLFGWSSGTGGSDRSFVTYQLKAADTEGQDYTEANNARRVGKWLERREKIQSLFVDRLLWDTHIGPYIIARSEGKVTNPMELLLDSIVRAALLGSLFKPNRFKQAAQRGIFYAGAT